MYQKHALSKTNEKRGRKMNVLCWHVCKKTRMLKLHYVLRWFWRAQKRMCARPWELLCENAHHDTSKFRSEIRLSKSIPRWVKKGVRFGNKRKNIRPVTKNEAVIPPPTKQRHAQRHEHSLNPLGFITKPCK